MTNVAELARLLEQGDLELPTLDDDELAALAPLLPPDARLVPLTTHADLDADARAARIEAGERSLIERGLLVETDGDLVAETPELRTILAVRDAPLAVTLVDVVRDGAVSSCHAYGLGAREFVLTETVEEGAHAFAVRSPTSTAEALADEIDPDGRSASSEGLVLVRTTELESPGWETVERAVQEAEATVRLYAVHRVGESELVELEASMAVAPDAVWLVAGEVDTRTGEGRLTARQLSRAGLVDALRSFLVLDGVTLRSSAPTG